MAKPKDIEVNLHVHKFVYDGDASNATRLVYVCRGCGDVTTKRVEPPPRVRPYPVVPPFRPYDPYYPGGMPWRQPYIGDPLPGHEPLVVWCGTPARTVTTDHANGGLDADDNVG